LKQDRNPRKLAASVLTVITGEEKEIAAESLAENPEKFASIFGQLLSGKTAEGAYKIDYDDRNIGFVFNADALAQIEQVKKELESSPPSSSPSPSPSPSPTPSPSGSQPDVQVSFIESINRTGWLGILSLFSIMFMMGYLVFILIERLISYRDAGAQSLEFAPQIAEALKNDRIKEAILISNKYQGSHLAEVVKSGLLEFSAGERWDEISGEQIDAARHAMKRVIDIKTAEFKRGLSGLANISWTAPLVGLLGLLAGIISAARSATAANSFHTSDVARNITSGLFILSVGLAAGIIAKLIKNYFTGKVEGLTLEMHNSASELTDYFMKRRQNSHGLNNAT
jgi:biopolymer transport protein ExbB/TolQ